MKTLSFDETVYTIWWKDSSKLQTMMKYHRNKKPVLVVLASFVARKNRLILKYICYCIWNNRNLVWWFKKTKPYDQGSIVNLADFIWSIHWKYSTSLLTIIVVVLVKFCYLDTLAGTCFIPIAIKHCFGWLAPVSIKRPNVQIQNIYA